jgi:transposase InsO family protein
MLSDLRLSLMKQINAKKFFSLLKHFGRFGAPLQLRSDNGPHFIAEVIKYFLSLVSTQHCLTLAYSKEENAIVERMNEEVNRHLRA